MRSIPAHERVEVRRVGSWSVIAGGASTNRVSSPGSSPASYVLAGGLVGAQ